MQRLRLPGHLISFNETCFDFKPSSVARYDRTLPFEDPYVLSPPTCIDLVIGAVMNLSWVYRHSVSGFAALGVCFAFGVSIDAFLRDARARLEASPQRTRPVSTSIQGSDMPLRRIDRVGVGTGEGERINQADTGWGYCNGIASNSNLVRSRSKREKANRSGNVREDQIPLKILSKQKPGYTYAARTANVEGTVILRVTFGANNRISSVNVIKGLPHGLTEQAVVAAHQMKFTAPERCGRPYTVSKAVHFNFNIY